MSRRSTPERIDTARHEATRARLVGSGMTPERADAWIAGWAQQATQVGLQRSSAYWEAAWSWIAAERQRRTRP